MQIANQTLANFSSDKLNNRKALSNTNNAVASPLQKSGNNDPAAAEVFAERKIADPANSTYQATNLRDAMRHLSLKYDVTKITPKQVDEMSKDLGESLKTYLKDGATQDHQDALVFILNLAQFGQESIDHARQNDYLVDVRRDIGGDTKFDFISATKSEIIDSRLYGYNTAFNSKRLDLQLSLFEDMATVNRSTMINGTLSSASLATLIRFQEVI
jgi:hypothetical protein